MKKHRCKERNFPAGQGMKIGKDNSGERGGGEQEGGLRLGDGGQERE